MSDVVLVVGASGKTGQRIVDQLLGLGHTVRAFSRHASQLPSHPQLERVDGDVLDAIAVRAAVRGVNGVIVCLGPAAGAAPDLCERGTAHVIAAMCEANVRRLVCVTGAMIGLPREQLGWVYRRIQASVPEAALADRRRQEAPGEGERPRLDAPAPHTPHGCARDRSTRDGRVRRRRDGTRVAIGCRALRDRVARP